jgi:hypothetical protein
MRMRREDHKMHIELSSRSYNLFFLQELQGPSTHSILSSRAHNEIVIKDGKSAPFEIRGQTVLVTRQRSEEIKGSVHSHIIEVVLEAIVGAEGLDEVDLLEVGLLVDDEDDVLIRGW